MPCEVAEPPQSPGQVAAGQGTPNPWGQPPGRGASLQAGEQPVASPLLLAPLRALTGAALSPASSLVLQSAFSRLVIVACGSKAEFGWVQFH